MGLVEYIYIYKQLIYEIPLGGKFPFPITIQVSPNQNLQLVCVNLETLYNNNNNNNNKRLVEGKGLKSKRKGRNG
jgi:hypothetical protein